MSYNQMKTDIRQDEIAYDPWGVVINWQFDLCDYLFWTLEKHVPDVWEFSPGIGGCDVGNHWKFEGVDYDDLIRFGNLLFRYASKLRLAGKDY